MRTKNKTLSLFCFALLAVGAPASTVTVPGSMAAAEGDASQFTGPFFGTHTHQYQIAESELVAQGVAPGYAFTGMRIRLGGGIAPNATNLSFGDFEVLLGEAVNAITSMSTTFANNVTGGQVVRSGALTFTAGSLPGGGTPNDWSPLIGFSTPYTYQGGDLILQIRRLAGSFNTQLDAASTYTGEGTLYAGVSGAYSSPTGMLSNFLMVNQLEYAVPEPGSTALVLSGLALVAAGARRRRRYHGGHGPDQR